MDQVVGQALATFKKIVGTKETGKQLNGHKVSIPQKA
jgi:hypothetical protein